jgi:hypothetical protein
MQNAARSEPRRARADLGEVAGTYAVCPVMRSVPWRGLELPIHGVSQPIPLTKITPAERHCHRQAAAARLAAKSDVEAAPVWDTAASHTWRASWPGAAARKAHADVPARPRRARLRSAGWHGHRRVRPGLQDSKVVGSIRASGSAAVPRRPCRC